MVAQTSRPANTVYDSTASCTRAVEGGPSEMNRTVADRVGREVACRAFGRLLEEWQKAGLSPAELVAGSGCPAEQLYDKHARISWASYRRIMANARRLWDDQGFFELGLVILDTPWAKHVAIPAKLLATALDCYRWIARPRVGVARQTFTCVEHTLREVCPGRLVMTSTMGKGYPPCREYFLVTRGALAALPRLLGLPLAVVQMEETANGARYDISYSESGGVVARLRRALGRPFTARAAAREIEEVHIELHQRNQELEEKNRELELRNAELERYAYTVSHDLKSPLVTIKGFLGLLEKDTMAGNLPRVRDDLEQIHRAADHMRRLMNELLELSRLGRISHPVDEVSLGELAREAIDSLSAAIAERRAEVVVQSDMPVVTGDRLRLLEVYQNLIENSVAFMGDQPQPRIEIGAEQQEHETVCFVADNGMGIDPRHHERVFGLFDRLAPDNEGTGIGLALVKRIVEVHGGQVWVESAGSGQGTTLRFTLPRHLDGASEIAPEA